jgi:hypothetical protein
MPKIVENKLKLDPLFFRLLEETIVHVVYPGGVLSGIPARWKYPLRLTCPSFREDSATFRG